MEENKVKDTIKLLKKEIEKLDKKNFKVYFFVYDTKGAPSGSLTYIYQTAYALNKLGYKVEMVYTDKDFVGVRSWLGDKYADLIHSNVEKDMVNASASDFIIIPEIFSGVMAQTKEVPCKRVVILQNYDFMTELITPGVTWGNMKIDTCVTTSSRLADRLHDVFPNVKTSIVRPCVDKMFENKTKEKKLIVNIVSKDGNDINSIMKPFKWKYPMYGFVAFRYLNGLPKEDFVKALNESAITVWNDPFTDFGISALEAMACGNIVIGKIPESDPEWLYKNDSLRDNGLWCYNTKDIPTLLGSVVQTFMKDMIPQEVIDNMYETVDEYSEEKQFEDIKRVYVDEIFAERKAEFEKYIKLLEENK